MTDKPGEFEDDKLDSLYRLGATEKPSDETRKIIFTAARKQAETNHSGLHLAEYFLQLLTSSRSLAFAAVMVIGISIVLQIQFDQPETIIPEFKSQLKQEPLPATSDSADMEISPSSSIVEEHAEEAPAKPMMRMPAPPAPVQPAEQKRREQLQDEARQEAARKQKQEAAQKKQTESERLKSLNKQFRSYLSSPAEDTAQGLMSQPVIQICDKLSESDCLKSDICILENIDGKLNCRDTKNICEENFIQAFNSPENCQPDNQCQFFKGDCQCDISGICNCEDKKIPQCVPVNQEDTD